MARPHASKHAHQLLALPGACGWLCKTRTTKQQLGRRSPARLTTLCTSLCPVQGAASAQSVPCVGARAKGVASDCASPQPHTKQCYARCDADAAGRETHTCINNHQDALGVPNQHAALGADYRHNHTPTSCTKQRPCPNRLLPPLPLRNIKGYT